MTQEIEDVVRLTRTFDTPRAVLWRMWTEPAEFAAWYGPDNATVEVNEMDVRPGGHRRVAMEVDTPDGPRRMSFAGQFREVDEPRRLVYTETTEGHPETQVELELHEEGGRTTLILTHHGIPAGSPGAAGWSMALDHLADRVAA
jgi:uncharacterized protein YndB with AHSA1/START domain